MVRIGDIREIDVVPVANLTIQLFQALGIDIHESKAIALLRQTTGYGPSNAAGSAR